MNAAARRQVLVAAHPEFADFQILPCLFLLRDHVDVITAGPDRNALRTECGLNVVPDTSWSELETPSFSLVLVAGAMDMRGACESPGLLTLLQRCAARGAIIGATSGGALVLHFAGLLAGHDYTTSIPAEGRTELGLDAARYREQAVVTDGNLITAHGWATLALGIAAAERLGVDVAKRATYLRGKAS